MLTPEQIDRVLSVLRIDVDEDDDGWYQHTKSKIGDCTPIELHLIASEWNWDDGWEALQAITEHPRCDVATALRIFWGGRPDYYLDDWMLSCDAEEYDVEHRDLLLDIQKRHAQGAFVRSGIAFDPGPLIEPCKHDHILPCMRETLEGLDLTAETRQIRQNL